MTVLSMKTAHLGNVSKATVKQITEQMSTTCSMYAKKKGVKVWSEQGKSYGKRAADAVFPRTPFGPH